MASRGRHIDQWVAKLVPDDALPSEFRLSRSRIMYIECKSEATRGSLSMRMSAPNTKRWFPKQYNHRCRAAGKWEPLKRRHAPARPMAGA